MPLSKKRHHHQHHHQHLPHTAGSQQGGTRLNALLKGGIIFFAVLGFLLCYFITERNIAWIITGTAVGAVAGYFFAKQMNKTFSK